MNKYCYAVVAALPGFPPRLAATRADYATSVATFSAAEARFPAAAAP